MTNDWTEEGHGFDHVEAQSDVYVLACRCGWRSAQHPSAQAAGQEWDQHLRDAEAGA